MLIDYNPDDYVTESSHTTCEYHKKHPGEAWPGCTCSASRSQRKKTQDEKLLDEQLHNKEP